MEDIAAAAEQVEIHKAKMKDNKIRNVNVIRHINEAFFIRDILRF